MSRKEELKSLIAKAIYKVVPNGRSFIFGSQANSEQLILADIDVGVDIGRALTLQESIELETELEQIETLYPIDLVDFYNVEESFRNVALKNIEPL